MAFMPAVLAVAAAVAEGVGVVAQGQQQARVARLNYMTAQRNAVSASDAAQTKQVRSDQEYAQLRGQQEATQAASGLDILGTTQMLTRQSTDNTRRAQAQDIRGQGEVQIAQARSEMEQAWLDGKAARANTVIGLTKSLISGARSVKKLSER